MKHATQILFATSLTIFASLAQAEITLSPLFSDHMVLQRDQPNKVWGWAEPGEKAKLSIDGQNHPILADADGKWHVTLDPLEVGGPYTLQIKGKNRIEISDILVGEVWLCSGQSNMRWNVSRTENADLEILVAKYPQIRHITVPRIASQTPLEQFEGKWEVVTPESIAEFSAVGYFFGRQLHQTLEVPIGLINNSWGGSAAEAWTPLHALEADERYAPLLERWEKRIAEYDPEAAEAEFQANLAAWEARDRRGRRPRAPIHPTKHNHRPANLYNGVLHPVIGYGMRGVIWYQGEANTQRAYQYRHLFPLMIQSWRDAWDQGDFPFYYVQLADFSRERLEPMDSHWAELREAQTMTLDRLPNVGQAVIIDTGEANDIHPRDKQTVAGRLARWALANNYGIDIAYHSPTYRSMEIQGDSILLTFDYAENGLYIQDYHDIRGFAIAGENRDFVWADAEIVDGNKVKVRSDLVPVPLAVRYGWAMNPVCNLRSKEGLPLTPFRTDDWPGITTDEH